MRQTTLLLPEKYKYCEEDGRDDGDDNDDDNGENMHFNLPYSRLFMASFFNCEKVCLASYVVHVSTTSTLHSRNNGMM